MPKTLEAHDKLIREIFEGAYQFKIPDYRDAPLARRLLLRAESGGFSPRASRWARRLDPLVAPSATAGEPR
jgi:hypothetical protein